MQYLFHFLQLLSKNLERTIKLAENTASVLYCTYFYVRREVQVLNKNLESSQYVVRCVAALLCFPVSQTRFSSRLHIEDPKFTVHVTKLSAIVLLVTARSMEAAVQLSFRKSKRTADYTHCVETVLYC